MNEIRIVTLHTVAATGALDDAPLRTYLRDREVLRSEPFFFFHEGRPACLVYLERNDVGPIRPISAESRNPLSRWGARPCLAKTVSMRTTIEKSRASRDREPETADLRPNPIRGWTAHLCVRRPRPYVRSGRSPARPGERAEATPRFGR